MNDLPEEITRVRSTANEHFAEYVAAVLRYSRETGDVEAALGLGNRLIRAASNIITESVGPRTAAGELYRAADEKALEAAQEVGI